MQRFMETSPLNGFVLEQFGNFVNVTTDEQIAAYARTNNAISVLSSFAYSKVITVAYMDTVGPAPILYTVLDSGLGAVVTVMLSFKTCRRGPLQFAVICNPSFISSHPQYYCFSHLRPVQMFKKSLGDAKTSGRSTVIPDELHLIDLTC